MAARLRFSPRSIALASLLLAGLASAAPAIASENMTPLLLTVQDAPVPFMGSDGQVHLVYELWMTNATSGNLTVNKVEVLGDGSPLQTLDSAAVAGRLQPVGQRESVGTLPKSTEALLFLHVILPAGGKVPVTLSHRVAMHVDAAPPQYQQMTEDGGAVTVDTQAVVVVGPPLQGERFLSADSCCDAARHTRAAMPVNGRIWIAQRFAVDWEQLDASGRIYAGPREDPKSYTIFGHPVLAVADATVVSVVDDQPEQTPGQFPRGITLDQADGNSVILDLGRGRFAMYAHMQPGSVRVRAGERVTRGQTIGLVGDSGNSIVPHLHFQVMAGPTSLSSNGLPYAIDSFVVSGRTPGTDAFDNAEAKGTPVTVAPISPAKLVKDALPLDQLIISFPPP